MGGLLLTGCKITLFGKTFYLFEKEPAKEEPEVKLPIPLMEEYGEYKLADSITAGTRYLLGIQRTFGSNKDQVRFFNGNYHEDNNGYYSFYMGTTQAKNGDTSFAAEIEAEDAGNGEFYFKVYTEDEELPWNNHYIGVYPSITTGKKPTLSLALLETPTSKTFTQCGYTKEGGQVDEEVTFDTVISKFKFFNQYDERTVKAPGFTFQHSAKDEDQPCAKFFGTSADFISFDCRSEKDPEIPALNPTLYDLAHLYVKK